MTNCFNITCKGERHDVEEIPCLDHSLSMLLISPIGMKENIKMMNKTVILLGVLAMAMALCGCNYKRTLLPEKSMSAENETDTFCDMLPNATNSWGNADNVEWIMKQLHKDTVPTFDFSAYHLSKEEELLADSCLRIAWYGDHTWFKMDYIREHYGTWKYVWRIFHIPNRGELGFVEQDVILKLYLRKHHPDLLHIGNDKAKHFANLQKHVMDSLTLNHQFLGNDIPTFAMNGLWYDYLRWYRIRLYKDAWQHIGVSIDKELWHTDRICKAVKEYKENTPHFGSGNGLRFTEFYMLYSTALDSMISDMCRICDCPQKMQMKLRKVYSTTNEDRLWRKFFHYEEYDYGHWEMDSGMVVGMERTRKLTNQKARQYKRSIKQAYKQWFAYRLQTSKKLAPQYREQYNFATMEFRNFIIAQCRNNFQYGID